MSSTSSAASPSRQVGALLQIIWRLARDRRRQQLTYLALLFTAQSIALTQPLLIGAMLNAVQAGGDVWPKLWPLLIGLFALELGFWLFHFPARVLERQLAFHIRLKFREEMTRAVTEMPMKWHRAHHSGETLDKVARASLALHDFAGNTFQLLYMVMGLLGPVVLLVSLAPGASAIALGVTIAAISIIFWFDRILLRQYRELNGHENSVAGAVQDYFTNITTVITLRLENSVVREVVRRSMKPYGTARSNYLVTETKWFLVSVLIAAMAASVLAGWAWWTVATGGVLLAGTFFKLFEYLRRVGSAFYQVAGLWGLTVRQAADLNGTLPIAEAHAQLVDHPEARLPAGWKKLEVSNLDFTYEDEVQRRHHLRDVQLTLERGKSIALVGASGCGKSTLLGVLRGLHSAKAHVRCDGVPLEHGLAALSHAATLFPQEPEIFSDTVRFNVAFGFEADDARLHEAVDRACFGSVLARLPKGLDTNVAEKGVNLSGGERQRLALARGLFFSQDGDSDVLLLDEATSSVDAVNEQTIYRTLKETSGDRCLVATIHKLHLLSFFDVVYFMKEGRVVDHGSVEELCARCPAFLELWEASVGPRRQSSPALQALA